MADKQAYSKAVKGKLSFKGAKVGLKKTQKRKLADDDDANDTEGREMGQQHAVAENNGTINIEDASAEEIKIISGTGRLTSSGTTILGHGTLFMNELSHGDAIIVTHPTTYADETKIVRMVLSNISISVSSAFSTDLISTAPFRFIKAPKDPSSSSSAEEEGLSKKRMMTGKGQQDSEEAAFGEYVSQGTRIHFYAAQVDFDHFIIYNYKTVLVFSRWVAQYNQTAWNATPFLFDTSNNYSSPSRSVQQFNSTKHCKLPHLPSSACAHTGGTKAVFRVRKKGAHGSYKMVTEDVKSNTSREDLLFMRSKRKSDRHCS